MYTVNIIRLGEFRFFFQIEINTWQFFHVYSIWMLIWSNWTVVNESECWQTEYICPAYTQSWVYLNIPVPETYNVFNENENSLSFMWLAK